MLSITRRISQYNHSAGNDIQYIVIHDTGNTTDSAAGNANYFCTGDRQSSAHYFVDDNSIYQVVEESDAAWHCGDGGDAYGIGNHNSIGIEMCRVDDDVTIVTESNTIELVQCLMSKYSVPIDNVVRHYDASRKNCPAAFSANNWARWNNFKAKLSGGSAPAQINPTGTQTANPTLVLQQSMNRLHMTDGRGNKLVEDGILGTCTKEATKRFQYMCGLEVDGIAGNQTNNCIQQILAKPLCGIPYVQRIPTRYLQWWLGISIDGVFGSGTANAVMSWQTKCGLSADGIVGNMSWSKIIG